jgi:hypothetical protein
MPALRAYQPIAHEGTPKHSNSFRDASTSPRADAVVVLGAKVLAQTAADLLRVPDRFASAVAEHQAMVRAGTVPGRQGWTIATNRHG